MVMGNGSCLPDQSYEMAMQPPCLYWTSVDQQFYDVGDGSRLNLCGSVDLMADVLFHSSLLQESQTLNINPMTTDAGGGGVLSGGTSATASLELNPVLGPTTTSSVDLPCSSIPPALQDALWWMTSSDLLSAALMAPTPNNTATTAPQDASSGGASPHLDIPVESASGYLPAVCKDEAGVSLQPSGILSHCAGNTAGHGCAVGVWRDLTATCCTSGNATSSGDSQESSEMYGHGGSYTNSGRSCGAAAVVDISFQPVTSRTQLVNDAAAIISSSPYNLGSLQADNAKGRRKQQQGCSSGSGGPLLQYAVNTTTAAGTSFSIDFENPTCTASTKPSKRPRSADRPLSSSASRRPSTPSIDFRSADTLGSASPAASYEPDPEAVAHVKEMIYRAAAFRPVNLGPEAVDRPRRKNVRISSDPQTVAARHRRERISERLRVLQRLVPGGSKMDTASMLDEAANYLKFLKSQVTVLEGMGTGSNNRSGGSGFRNAIMNAASTSSCGGIPLLPSSILGSSSSLTRMDHGFSIPTQISTPKTIPSQLRDHSIELGNRALH